MVLITTTKPVDGGYHFRPLGSACEGIHPVFARTYQRRATVMIDGVGGATGETIEDAWDRMVRLFKEEKKEKVNWKKEGF